MGLALTYAQSITQILNFLIRVTAELEVNVSIKFNYHFDLMLLLPVGRGRKANRVWSFAV